MGLEVARDFGGEDGVCSDGEDDNVPLVTLVANQKLNVIADAAANVTVPEGESCVGLEVARDFGGEHGVCFGTIVRVDMNRRRALYLEIVW